MKKLFVLSFILMMSFGAAAQIEGKEWMYEKETYAETSSRRSSRFVAKKIVNHNCKEIIVDKEKSCTGGYFSSDNIYYTCKLKKPYKMEVGSYREGDKRILTVTEKRKSIDYAYQSDCQEVLSLYL